MTKLEKLIKELCPNGVKHKTLGEICQIVRGASPRPIKSYITSKENGVPWIKIGDVSTGAKYVTSTEEYITEEGAQKSRKVYKGDFILSNSMSFGRPYILKIDGCIHDGWLSISGFQEHLSPDFLYYILSSSLIQREMAKKASFGGAVQNLNADIVRRIAIPVPPLPVQEEIVRILDELTEKTDKLILELIVELEERKKQFNYYLNACFPIESKDSCESKSLSEIGKFIRGKRFVKTDIIGTGTPCIHYGELYTYYGVWAEKAQSYLNPASAKSLRFANKNDIVIVGAGEDEWDIGIGVAWLNDEDVVIHDACYAFSHSMNPKYVSYFLRSDSYHLQIKPYVRTGKISAISSDDIGKARLLLPSLAEQEQTAELLDEFSLKYKAIIDKLKTEIESRKKQYEYYRDRLLTFN